MMLLSSPDVAGSYRSRSAFTLTEAVAVGFEHCCARLHRRQCSLPTSSPDGDYRRTMTALAAVPLCEKHTGRFILVQGEWAT